MANTRLVWENKTWNPVTGCTAVSDGCANCYAKKTALRLKKQLNPRYEYGFTPTVHHAWLAEPGKWKKPRRVSACSMGDLFHEDIPTDIIKKVFATMNDYQQHTFMVSTKRPKRLSEISSQLYWTSNIYCGVSVESNAHLDRIDDLRETEAQTKFVAFEPLLENIVDPNLEDIDWVIVGGELGPENRALEPDWVRALLLATQYEAIPFYFRQWGGPPSKKKTDLPRLDGKIWDETPP